MSKKAFSYARFSTSEQLDGRSLQRQQEAANAYCRRHDLTLDERSFTDLGLSGYSGSNVKGGELGVFLELVKEGRIPKGSTLIIENVDRLSRLPPDEATEIIMSIVKGGVDIVTTSPEQRYTAANIRQVGTWIPLQVSACLASEESRKKSDRLRDAWGDKRAKLADGHKMSLKGPGWLRLSADREDWIILEDKARAVRRAFELAAEGRGIRAIAAALNEECPEGLAGKGWSAPYVSSVLRNRAVLGEYLPHAGTCAKKGGVKSTRKPAGDPIKEYFPAIVSEPEFYRAQDALDKRRGGGGRQKGTANLFGSLMINALDGHPMVIASTCGRKVFVSAGAARGVPGCPYRAIDYTLFERAVLDRLLELKPSDVLAKPAKDDDPMAVWSVKLTIINRNLATMQQQASAAEDVSVFVPILQDLGRQKKEATAALEKAKGASASREGDVLGETQSLVKLLDDAEGEERETLRRKIRAALRRLVESAHVLVVVRGRVRLVALQLHFRGGKRRRDYLLAARQGTRSAPARMDGYTLAKIVRKHDFDLRRLEDTVALEELLLDLDPATLG
jgi:DNA invertase Pin-like site-specific DNA recombinase